MTSYLVVDEQFEPVLRILELQQTFKKHSDERGGLLNEDANYHQWKFTLLWEDRALRELYFCYPDIVL